MEPIHNYRVHIYYLTCWFLETPTKRGKLLEVIPEALESTSVASRPSLHPGQLLSLLLFSPSSTFLKGLGHLTGLEDGDRYLDCCWEKEQSWRATHRKGL